MKILKTVAIIVAALIALPLIAAIFIPKTYYLERSIVINAPQPIIMDYVSHLKKAEEWIPWAHNDPTMKITYGGIDGTVGATSSWTSEDMGAGTQTITLVSPNRVEAKMEFTEPMGSSASDFIQTVSVDGGTKVIWGMTGSDPYPFNIMVPFLDMMVGKDFEAGLAKLKEVAEAKAAREAQAQASQP